MDKRTIYQVDAFADKPFKGNPAGVMMVDESFTDEWMQNMAAEMNLSETAFILATGTDFHIRYFTPTHEVPLCGHATLASAHVIYELGIKNENESFVFHAKGGELTINKDKDLIVMDFPVYPLSRIDLPANFRKTIGFEPSETYSSSYNWIIAVAGTEEDIKNAAPEFESMNSNGLGHLMITAKSISADVDFIVRCFAPALGINEDPVTGSAHCALTPLWAEKLGKTEMVSLQVSKRSGQLKVKLVGDRVEIKGKAVTVFVAELKL